MAATRTISQNAAPLTLQNIALSPPVFSDSSNASSQSVPSESNGREFAPPTPLRSYFDALLAAHGPQHWWPGRTRFEIIVGAILTQNTSWTNAERAVRNLRAARMLSPQAIRRVRSVRLAQFLRPSGYFRQKAKTLKSFVNFLYESYARSLSCLFATLTDILRAQLLSLLSIVPQTD